MIILVWLVFSVLIPFGIPMMVITKSKSEVLKKTIPWFAGISFLLFRFLLPMVSEQFRVLYAKTEPVFAGVLFIAFICFLVYAFLYKPKYGLITECDWDRSCYEEIRELYDNIQYCDKWIKKMDNPRKKQWQDNCLVALSVDISPAGKELRTHIEALKIKRERDLDTLKNKYGLTKKTAEEKIQGEETNGRFGGSL